MRSSKDKMTFKDCGRYLWSLIILGINWMVYKKMLIVLLTVLILVGVLVWSPLIGFILCLLTPVFLTMHGKYLYFNMKDKYPNVENSENQRFLILFIIINYMDINYICIYTFNSFIYRKINLNTKNKRAFL